MKRSAIPSRLFAGSITRPLRIMVALMSRERTRPACWRRRPRRRGLFWKLRDWENGRTEGKIVSARRRNQHARGVCFPDPRAAFSCCNPSAQIKNSHSHRETVGDLVENDALQAVGYFA